MDISIIDIDLFRLILFFPSQITIIQKSFAAFFYITFFSFSLYYFNKTDISWFPSTEHQESNSNLCLTYVAVTVVKLQFMSLFLLSSVYYYMPFFSFHYYNNLILKNNQEFFIWRKATTVVVVLILFVDNCSYYNYILQYFEFFFVYII